MQEQSVVKPHRAVTVFTFLTLAFDGCSVLAAGLLWAVLAALSDHIGPDPNEDQRLILAGIVLLVTVAYSIACLIAFMHWQGGKRLGNVIVLGLGWLHMVVAIYVASFSSSHAFLSDLLYALLMANLTLSLIIILRKAHS